MRDIAKIKEKLSRRAKKKSRETLWKRRPRRNTAIRVRVVYRRSDSDIHRV